MNQGNIQFFGTSASSGGGGGTVTGANDGLTLSGALVQLGQPVGTGGDPAAFTEDREMPMNGKRLFIKKGEIVWNNGPVNESTTEYVRFKSPHQGDVTDLDYVVFQESVSAGVNPNGSFNQPVKMGFNASGSQDPNQPGQWLSMEPNYRPGPPGPGNQRYMEFHQEISTPSGAGARLYSTTTIFTADDRDIQTSQTDVRASKWNFMDLQSHQLLEIQMQTGRLESHWYKAPAINNQSVYIGWDNTGADQFNLNNFGGGTNVLNVHGWSAVDFQGVMIFNSNQSLQTIGGIPKAFLGDILSSGGVDNTYSIGAGAQAYKNVFLYNLFFTATATVPPATPGAMYTDGMHAYMYLNGAWKQLDN